MTTKNLIIIGQIIIAVFAILGIFYGVFFANGSESHISIFVTILTGILTSFLWHFKPPAGKDDEGKDE